MKKILLAILIIMTVFAFANAVQANTIALYDPGSRYSNGGPFNALLGSPDPGLVDTSFTTFCLEKTEYFYAWGVYYDYAINPYAIGGGANHDSTTPGKDYLDPRSAWLYYQFRTNNPDYQNLQALQAAFWIIEDEMTLGGTPASGSVEEQALKYITDATGKWSDIGPVVVLNLYDTAHGQLQSQLGLAVPEPATMLLLGLGLVGLAGVRRKIKE